MRVQSSLDRKTCSVAWTTNASATTAVDDTTTLNGKSIGWLKNVMIKTHSWDVVAEGASGCSGAYVEILDDNSNRIFRSAEVLTGTTTLLMTAGDGFGIPIVGAYTVRYRMCDGQNSKETRVTSGSSVPWSHWNDPEVYLYIVE